jgi:hypothetical protein
LFKSLVFILDQAKEVLNRIVFWAVSYVENQRNVMCEAVLLDLVAVMDP